MKNIHIVPTKKPSRLCLYSDNTLWFLPNMGYKLADGKRHIHITSDEEIKEEDWYYIPRTNSVYKCTEDSTELNLERRLGVAKIILTTDQDLINDGVQSIDDEFLEWFVKNTTCEVVDVKLNEFEVDMELGDSCIEYGSYYKIIIPKEDSKQEYCNNCGNDICCCIIRTKETLEEAVENYSKKSGADVFQENHKKDFMAGAKWQEERMYGEKDMLRAFEAGHTKGCTSSCFECSVFLLFNEWFEQFKKK